MLLIKEFAMWYSHVKQVMSPEFCNALIQKAEDIGFVDADVRFYKGTKRMENVRNNSRIEFQDPLLLKEVEGNLLNILGNDFPYKFRNPKLDKEVIYTGLNDHLRFYRYIPGQYFKPHKDGGYTVGEQESLITLLLYLNDTDGGETILMPDGAGKPETFITINPHVGDILMFEHPAWHEGRPVSSGVKYVLRSDVFYNK